MTQANKENAKNEQEITETIKNDPSTDKKMAQETKQDLERLSSTSRAKVLLILGPLGSGKTTFVNFLLRSAGNVLGKVMVIVNDVGATNVDAERIENADKVGLSAGCICCDDLESLQDTLGKIGQNIDTVIIEPTGIADGGEIRRVLDEMNLNARSVVLLDVLHHKQNVEHGISNTQLKVADLVGLTWWQSLGENLQADDDQLAELMDYIGEHAPGAPVMMLPDTAKLTEEYFGSGNQFETHRVMELFKSSTSRTIVHSDSCEDDEHQHCDHNHEEQEHDHDHPHGNITAYSIDLQDNLTLHDLKTFLTEQGPSLIRAKGVVDGKQFNFVHGSLRLGISSPGQSRANFIFDKKFEESGFDRIKGEKKDKPEQVQSLDLDLIQKLMTQYAETPEAELLNLIESNIERLLKGYARWNELDKEQKRISGTGDYQRLLELETEMQEVGDSIICDDPLTWIGTQYFAYKGTESQIDDYAGFIKHCKGRSPICGRRFDFLSNVFQEKFGYDMESSEFASDDATWPTFLADQRLRDLLRDKETINAWLSYERCQIDGRIAKWKNYKV